MWGGREEGMYSWMFSGSVLGWEEGEWESVSGRDGDWESSDAT